jgi:transposase
MHADSSPNRPKRYSLFCGIDIAKDNHVACVMDRDGTQLVRSQSFANNAEGYRQILERLGQIGGPRRMLVGMEATGHYWFSLHDFLVDHRYQVAVLNPIQTHQQAKKGIRKTQTDKIDARHIATLIKNGEHKPALIPTEFGRTCRQLTRLHHHMVRQETRIKQLLWAFIHPTWPEYEGLFAHAFCGTGRTLLRTAPTPSDVRAMSSETLEPLIRKASHGRCAGRKAQEIRQAAENTVGTHRALEAARIGIRCLLDQLDVLEPVRESLEKQIETLAERLPRYLFTLPGAGPVSVVSLFGETDPITAFASPSKLVAFAGLDVVVSQSGPLPKDPPRRHISKTGSPALRYTLWQMARLACCQEGDLQDYYRRRRAAGLGHLATVTAAAVKLCHIAWRIMIDQRDYLPQRPTTPS